MNLGEVIKEAWFNLTIGHRLLAAAVVLVIAGMMVSGWVAAGRSWLETRVYERQAAEAERQKDAALTQAAKIAATIKVREEELVKVEVKKDAKQKDVDKARSDVDRDRAEYERAVRSRIANAPSTDDLCAQLAAAGHACQTR